MSVDTSPTAPKVPDPRLPVRAGQLLRVRPIWVIPLVLSSVVVAVMTTLYISSVVDPLAHLRGLPVAVVNQDHGATIGAQHLDVGEQVVSGLRRSPAVSSRLHMELTTLPQAERAMSTDSLYATLVIPSDFTTNLLNVSGLHGTNTVAVRAPRIEILINERAGTVGTELATGILQPALAVASHQIGQHLSVLVPAGSQTAATKVFLANPVTVAIVEYAPLPPNSALGLSAFYIALLTIMCGFLAATIVNSAVDSALGYATNDIGPRWSQRQPVPINRWQTLLIKWPIVAVVTGVLTALMIVIAAAGLGMDAPSPALLWLYTWLCAASVGIGTVVLFAVAGSSGQLLALLLFVYAGLASAGGTVPVEALPGPLHALSDVEPLRQILAGTRSILYFGAKGDAGLTRGTLAAGLGLLFWLAVGALVVRWYDRKRMYRLPPDLLSYVSDAVEGYHRQKAGTDSAAAAAAAAPAAAAAAAAAAEPRPSDEADPARSLE